MDMEELNGVRSIVDEEDDMSGNICIMKLSKKLSPNTGVRKTYLNARTKNKDQITRTLSWRRPFLITCYLSLFAPALVSLVCTCSCCLNLCLSGPLAPVRGQSRIRGWPGDPGPFADPWMAWPCSGPFTDNPPHAKSPAVHNTDRILDSIILPIRISYLPVCAIHGFSLQ